MGNRLRLKAMIILLFTKVILFPHIKTLMNIIIIQEELEITILVIIPKNRIPISF